ncbi:heterokaryon incompatibility protein-domain-containing protein [Lasiosphaeria ovina]|uniref:Heterokaryon incompatibility protein-domain-containing protein n=1 Tax=Lasiosphaeria ovina TaxID=92902 RepID=A0AAE0K3Q2_9PEZI|nr:heterokaryon incompatibility protein-domain-containing protein [Lasiosphaeria ovina]
MVDSYLAAFYELWVWVIVMLLGGVLLFGGFHNQLQGPGDGNGRGTAATEQLVTRRFAISSNNCRVCQALLQAWGVVAGDPPKNILMLGSFEDVMAMDCPTHKSLIEAYVRAWEENYGAREARGHPRWTGRETSMMLSLSDERPLLQEFGTLGDASLEWSLSLAKSRSQPIGQGRILDPNYIDLNVIKHWMSDCQAHHGAACSNPMRLFSISPAWLVDVEQKCLVPGHSRSGPFVALSYRWGTAKRFQVGPLELQLLRQPHILDDRISLEEIPAMVHHAIHLASVLGIRYLWVDMLCIVHGEGQGAAKQLNLMGAIYASAIVTIVAADGDGSEGIAGLKGVPGSASRNLSQQIIRFGDEKVVIRRGRMVFLEGDTPYYTRGWTYQERLMATRKIYFQDGQVHWECRRVVLHEETSGQAEVFTVPYSESQLRQMLAGFPKLSELQNVINDYNVLDLTNEEDALPGSLGVLSVLSRTFKGGFLYGLPEMFFDAALGWQPDNPQRGPMTRRRHSDRAEHLKLFKSGLPSWSWIGWKGRISMGWQEALLFNDLQSYIHEVTPITRWFTGRSPTTPEPLRREIRPYWFENRRRWKRLAPISTLPEGWTRHEVRPVRAPSYESGYQQALNGDRAQLWPDGCGRFVYSHRKFPRDKLERHGLFFYPFPVPNIDEFTPSDMPEQTAFLFCRTLGARLWAREQDLRGNFDLEAMPVQLFNEVGNTIGTLQPHDGSQMAEIRSASRGNKLGAEVTVVAINMIRRQKLTRYEGGLSSGYPLIIQDIYTVLWVEWEGGVAYRKGVGSVEKAMWEQLKLYDFNLVLG